MLLMGMKKKNIVSHTKLSIVDAFTNSPEKLHNLMKKIVSTVNQLHVVPSIGSSVLLPLNLCAFTERYTYWVSCINPVCINRDDLFCELLSSELVNCSI